ncbi:MAG: TIR domain-containing protein [Verrucomicrobia bacterium]|nr:TIR domain-containing protein [Verrucomicrobiota bacterium]
MTDRDQFEFDVFISYSSKDKAWVRGELLKRLEEAGLKAIIYFRDFTPGAASIKEMEHGVVKCRKTLLVLTPNYLESEWCEIEFRMAQTLDPANRDHRIVPLLRTECEKPLSIAALTHIDFTDGADHDLAWRQLLTALDKRPEPEPPKQPERGHWFLAHPYPMPPNFTGRLAEREMLSRWLEADPAHPLLSLRALGGFGKSALVWHWLTQDVAPAAWPRVVWWSFYEGDASFEHFLVETLQYLYGERMAVGSMSARDQLTALLQALCSGGTLLVLDGFERALRAYGGLNAAYQGDEVAAGVPPAVEDGILPPGKAIDNTSAANASAPVPPGRMPGSTAGKDACRYNDCDCLSPLAEIFLRGVATLPGIRAKVLLTTRLCPRVLEAKGAGLLQGCREEELRQMQPADAVEFFRAQGIRGTHTEIEQACEPYGYHPLSLRLLAGLIVGDFQQPGDIAAAKRLDVSGDLVQRQHHVLETAYDSLTPERQALLGRIACFRSPVKYDALKALAEADNPHPGPLPSDGRGRSAGRAGTKQPRDIVPTPDALALSRRTGEGARRAGEGSLDKDLRDLVARGLLHHDTKEGRFDLHPIVRRYAYDRLAATDRVAAHTRLRDYFAGVPQPDKVTRLKDLTPVIELYHHTVRAGQFDEACALFRDRLHGTLYFQLGAYQLIIDLLRALFPDGEDRPPRLKDERWQAWTLNSLANSYSLSGQLLRAVPLYVQCNFIREKHSNKTDLAMGLGNVAYMAQLPIGALRAAEAKLRRSIALGREVKVERREAIGHRELGLLLAYRGAWDESEKELTTALKMFEKQSYVRGQALTWAYRALRELLLLRAGGSSESRVPNSVLESARHALELEDETARTRYLHPRDFAEAHWLLGAAHRVAGQTDEAERHLHEALERCRRINDVMDEADILIDLARLRAATGASDEAQRLAEEALLITERSGYVLQCADAHLELAKLALTRGDKAAAKDHAQKARRLATCDGPPDYTYKAAYDEAGALLEQLKRD